MPVASILLILLTGTSSLVYAIPEALALLGLFMMFPKSGVRNWHALIPGVREYQLARCAGCESDGPVFAATQVSVVALTVALFLYNASRPEATNPGAAGIAILSVQVCLFLVNFIYAIRVYTGIVEVYGVRKRWLWLWLLPVTSFIPALIWGFSGKYQPGWRVEDIRAELRRLARQGSATVMDEGLTVNLRDRAVMKFFRKKVLLRDIHMAIPGGRMVLLLGGPGAGKTTFLNAISGYERANAEIMLNGEDLYRQYGKMRYEVGFVPQREMMRGRNTVHNTLMDAAKLRLPMDVSPADRKSRVDEVLELFGLTPVKGRLVEKLSGGQRKRLSISMEFLSNPSLFILDEPDTGLDDMMARQLFELLRGIADTGRIVVVITRTPDRVIDLFDDVIVLAEDSARTGRLAFYGSVGDARAFFGRERMEQIVRSVSPKAEGGDGLADEYVLKYAEVQHG